MLIISDVHIGFHRQAGTTPASREALREYLHGEFGRILTETDERELFIVGDLFDDFEVDPRDWYFAYLLLSRWLRMDKRLALLAGNHDHSPKGERMSSFEMLARVLSEEYADQVHVIGIDERDWLSTRVNAIAHCSSQQVFEQRLNEALAEVKEGDYVFVHANFDNNFAAQTDHSLNVTRSVARQFVDKGASLVFAHEHQGRTAFEGKVYVMGNNFPTSVADCLGNTLKSAHILTDGQLCKRATWSVDGPEAPYTEADWRQLDAYEGRGGFIRVIGTATAAEASDVVNAIAAYRRTSDAFIITNAVKVDGIVQAEELPASFEAAKKFDVLQFIREQLTEDEMKAVERLLEAP